MRTIKVLRTPEDVLSHKSLGVIETTPEPVVSQPADPVDPPDDPPADPVDPPADPVDPPADQAEMSFDEMVEDLKSKHKADELEAIAASLGLEIKGNKTEVATAIVTKQMETKSA